MYLSLDLFLPIILHIPFDALNPFRHYLLISYMLLPDVGIWCNRALCVETAHSTYFTATSPLVSVLFVPSLHSYYFSRKFLFFSSLINYTYVIHSLNYCSLVWRSCRKSNLQRLQRLQNLSARIILKLPKPYSATSAINTLQWRTLEEYRDVKILKLTRSLATATYH